MELNQALIAELQMEAANTRKILKSVPMDNHSWKPHEKSMSIGRLAAHVAELASWVTMTMKTDELDFANFDYKPRVPTTSEELLAILDHDVAEAIAILNNSTAEDFGKMWTMRRGEQVFFTLPKAVVLRSWAYNHTYHHRGQLSVYLRLLDVHVPGMYGPSADDMAHAAASAAAPDGSK